MTRLFSYSKYRKQGFSARTARRLAEPSQFGDRAMLGLLLGILVAICFSLVANYIATREKVAAQSTQNTVEHLEAILIGCLEKGTMVLDGVVHECRPVSLHLKVSSS